MYKKFSRQMFRSRCISEGVRTCAPDATEQMYTPDEIRAIEIETQRTLRAVFRFFQPQKTRFGINITMDQPGAGHAIHPQVTPGCPLAALIARRIAQDELRGTVALRADALAAVNQRLQRGPGQEAVQHGRAYIAPRVHP